MVVDESFKQDLRSVLMSEKNGVNILRLNLDYRDLVGKNIDFDRRLYADLESFICTLTDTCYISK